MRNVFTETICYLMVGQLVVVVVVLRNTWFDTKVKRVVDDKFND